MPPLLSSSCLHYCPHAFCHCLPPLLRCARPLSSICAASPSISLPLHPCASTTHALRLTPSPCRYRWHIDAALYERDPPRVTTLMCHTLPAGPRQVVRYDDGTGDELEVPLATTAFISGAQAFALLPPAMQAFALVTEARYHRE